MGNKCVPVSEAAIILDTTIDVIRVTVCAYKKKHGENPRWCMPNGRKWLVDVAYLIDIRDREMKRHRESIELYYFLYDDMKMNNAAISREIMRRSEIYDNATSWLNFMQSALFCIPMMKFYDRVTRLSEFHKISKQIVEEYKCQPLNLEK